jgi:hypothetical protein
MWSKEMRRTLNAEVDGLVLLLAVLLATSLADLLVEDGEDAGDLLAHDLDLSELRGTTVARNLQRSDHKEVMSVHCIGRGKNLTMNSQPDGDNCRCNGWNEEVPREQRGRESLKSEVRE